MAHEIDKIIKWACSQGWTVRTDGNGYRRFYTPGGDYVVRYPATPGREGRRLAEVITAIRHHGLVWPAPSKGEQRAQRRQEAEK